MRAHLDAALAGHGYTEMRDREIRYWRSTSEQAWAARAIASRRKGTLAPAVADGAAYRRHLGVQPPRMGGQDPKHTHEYYALLSHVEELCETTAYPDRVDAPEDEPLVEQLLAAGTRRGPSGARTLSKYDMAEALLAAEQAPAEDQAPTLSVVLDPRERAPPLRSVR